MEAAAGVILLLVLGVVFLMSDSAGGEERLHEGDEETAGVKVIRRKG